MSSASFWRFSFVFALPCWLTWQLGWYVAFQYGFNYEQVAPDEVIRAKLIVELIFFIVCGTILCTRLCVKTQKGHFTASLMVSVVLILLTLRGLLLV